MSDFNEEARENQREVFEAMIRAGETYEDLKSQLEAAHQKIGEQAQLIERYEQMRKESVRMMQFIRQATDVHVRPVWNPDTGLWHLELQLP